MSHDNGPPPPSQSKLREGVRLTIFDLVVWCFPRPLLGHEPVIPKAQLVLLDCTETARTSAKRVRSARTKPRGGRGREREEAAGQYKQVADEFVSAPLNMWRS